jgi:serine O-acetyltransferase
MGGNTGGVPTLLDNVHAGGGSFVVGGITLGNNVTVGANSFVNKDVPDNAIVAGSPAKIIKFKENNEDDKRKTPLSHR